MGKLLNKYPKIKVSCVKKRSLTSEYYGAEIYLQHHTLSSQSSVDEHHTGCTVIHKVKTYTEVGFSFVSR